MTTESASIRNLRTTSSPHPGPANCTALTTNRPRSICRELDDELAHQDWVHIARKPGPPQTMRTATSCVRAHQQALDPPGV